MQFKELIEQLDFAMISPTMEIVRIDTYSNKDHRQFILLFDTGFRITITEDIKDE